MSMTTSDSSDFTNRTEETAERVSSRASECMPSSRQVDGIVSWYTLHN